MPRVISVADFGAVPGAADCTAALARAAAACRGSRDTTLLLPPGRYPISRARASETAMGISNHEPGILRRVALHLRDCEGLTVSARGAELVASGQVVPLVVEGGRDIAIDGLTIDWSTPLHAWGEVVGGWNGWVDVRVNGGHPWRILRDRLNFIVDGQPEEHWGTYAIDPKDMTPAETSGENLGSAFTIPWVAEPLADGIVRLRTHVVRPPPAGQLVILRHGVRVAPGLVGSGVERIRVSDVTIRQAGGMALIMQRCADPLIERLQVVAGEGRPLSANHDATHFLSCRGTVRLLDGVFERQLDDATNVHGIGLQIVERLGARGVVVRLAHIEQRGCVAAVPGERFAVVDRETMLRRADLVVSEVRPVNGEFIELECASAFPAQARAGDVLESLDGAAAFEARGCRVAHNRARGFLVSTGNSALIERCRFETPGPAIHFHGDVGSWFESGAVTEATVRDNDFVRCGYAREPRWGGAVITATPEIKRHAGHYHQRLAITGNRFAGCLLPTVEARAVASLTVRGNTGAGGKAAVIAKDCGEVAVDD
jgi:hypothetical protein